MLALILMLIFKVPHQLRYLAGAGRAEGGRGAELQLQDHTDVLRGGGLRRGGAGGHGAGTKKTEVLADTQGPWFIYV